MDYFKLAVKKSKNISLVIWRDPSEGTGEWKNQFDGSAKYVMECGYVVPNPKIAGDWIVYRSQSLEDNDRGAEMYIPGGCVVEIIPLKLTDNRLVMNETN